MPHSVVHRVLPPRARPCDPLPGGGNSIVQLPDDAGVGAWHVAEGNSLVITGDSVDCVASNLIASGLEYRLDPERCILNGFQPTEGESMFDGLHWRNAEAPWVTYEVLDAGGVPQSELADLFAQIGGITPVDLACMTQNVPGDRTVAAVLAAVAALDAGSDPNGGVTGEIDRQCNGAVVEQIDPATALSQQLHVRGIAWTDQSATLLTTAFSNTAGHIECGNGGPGETQPCCG